MNHLYACTFPQPQRKNQTLEGVKIFLGAKHLDHLYTFSTQCSKSAETNLPSSDSSMSGLK